MVLRGFDDDGAGGGGGETVRVGHDVVDGVGRGGRGVERDRINRLSVEEEVDAEVEVRLRAGDGRAEVAVAVAGRDVRGVRAVDLYSGWVVCADGVPSLELPSAGFAKWERRSGAGLDGA